MRKFGLSALLLLALAASLAGCAGATGIKGYNSPDPTERGLSYVAAAIVTSALIRGVMNK